MATRKPMKKFKRYEGGGEVMGEMDPREAAAKKRGLDISNKEAPVGFFDRIKAGNIDQPGSEAYNRFGAGRGYAQNMDDENEAMRAANRTPSAPAAPAPSAPSAPSARPLTDPMYADYGSNTSSSETIKPARQVITKPTLPAKPTAPVKRLEAFDVPSNPNYSNEGRNKPAPVGSGASQIPGQSTKAPKGEKIDSSETSRNLENAATALGVGAGAAGLYKLGSKLFRGGKEAASKAAPYLKELGTSAPKKLLGGPRKASKSSDVTDVVPKSTEMKRLGKPSLKKSLDESDTTGGAIGYKRGGKMKKYASGGMVSSASRRADGIATKGKTRCKIC